MSNFEKMKTLGIEKKKSQLAGKIKLFKA